MRDIVDCDHWRDCKIDGGGCCAENRFSKPSTGVCNTLCKFRISNGELKNPNGIGQYLTKLELSRIAAIAETKASALKYAAAELTHATQGPASEADAAARLAICMACEHRAVEYKGMKDENGVGWCTRCGCGSSPRALLWPVKLKMASVECPLGKFKAVSGTGATLASAVDAVAGVTQSIIHKLTGG